MLKRWFGKQEAPAITLQMEDVSFTLQEFLNDYIKHKNDYLLSRAENGRLMNEIDKLKVKLQTLEQKSELSKSKSTINNLKKPKETKNTKEPWNSEKPKICDLILEVFAVTNQALRVHDVYDCAKWHRLRKGYPSMGSVTATLYYLVRKGCLNFGARKGTFCRAR